LTTPSGRLADCNVRGAVTWSEQENVCGGFSPSLTVTENGNDPPFGAVPLNEIDAPDAADWDRNDGPFKVQEYVPVPPLTESGIVNAAPATMLPTGHVGPVIVKGPTTRTVQLNVADEPRLSLTVAVIAALPAPVGVPVRVMEAPVVAEGVNGPVAVQVYVPDPPATLSGRLNVAPARIGCVGHVPVICKGAPTTIVHVNVAATTPTRLLVAASVTVTVIGYCPDVVAVPWITVFAPDPDERLSPEFPPLSCHEYTPEPPVAESGMLIGVPGANAVVGHDPTTARGCAVTLIVQESVAADCVATSVSVTVKVAADVPSVP
jgi:hypothetical protein